MPRLTAEQHAERASGMGATDVVIAAGLSRFMTPYELYLEKIGELPRDEGSDQAERGHRLEPIALEWDRDIRGGDYERVSRSVRHPRIPFLFAHPDARRKPWRTTRRLVEVKTARRKWDVVPRDVEAQVQVQMACAKAVAVDVVVLGFDGPPDRLVVERDDETIAALEELAIAFWGRVERREPPELDGSVGASQWLDRTRWRDDPEAYATPVQRRLLAELISIDERSKLLDQDAKRIKNILKDTMAGGSRLVAPGIGRVNWTAPSTSERTAWKEVAGVLRRVIDQTMAGGVVEIDGVSYTFPDDLDAIESLYTSAKDQRKFLVYPERED